jgi:hypothetical protein
MMLKSFVHTVATPLKKWGRTCPREGKWEKEKKKKNGGKWEGKVNKGSRTCLGKNMRKIK